MQAKVPSTTGADNYLLSFITIAGIFCFNLAQNPEVVLEL
jgi:hypothetical protein